MQPVSFPGATEIKKPNDMTDEQCFSVWAKYGFGKLHELIELKKGGVEVVPPIYAGVDTENFPFYLTAWQPSYEDLQALNAGRPIFIKTVSTRLPPMAVFTIDEEGKSNDAADY